MRAVDIIIKKRNGEELSQEEIEFFIQGFTRGDICRAILSGIKSSWLPDDRKDSLAARFRERPSWVDS